MDAATSDRVVDRHHNDPPLKERLALEYQALVDEAGTIAADAEGVRKEVEDDKQLGVLGGVVIKAREFSKRADDARKAEKEPFLTAGRDIDAFFAVLTERMGNIMATLGRLATDYQRQKEAKARQEREAAAAALRAEEARQRELAEAEAARNRPTAAARKTAVAEQTADRAAEAGAAARAPAPELTRTRAGDGTLATTTTKWAAEIVDYDALDLNELRQHIARADVEKALRSYVKVNRDSRPLAGVRIFKDTQATFR